jgi:D-inositol-3-phosphate glycosyltransferase
VDQRQAGSISVWIVDPIDYSGMAYYDEGLAGGLAAAGASVTIVGTERRLLPRPSDARWRHRAVFRGTSGPGSRAVRGLRYLLGLARLLRAARRGRPDAIVWEYLEIPLADLLTMQVLRHVGTTVAFVAHEVRPWSSSRFVMAVRRSVVRGSDLVFAHGEPEADEVRRIYSMPAAKVVVTGHGDFRTFVTGSPTLEAARTRLGIPAEAPVALFFGSQRPSKGLALLLDAWPLVRAGLPDALLVIAGRVSGGGAACTLPEGVDLRTGTVPPDLTNAFFAAADVVVLPYDRITTSGVLRHAYSAGRPVVATAVGELVRHVVPGQTGWLTAPGDPADLARATVEALADRSATAVMGVKAAEYGRRAFDWDVVGRVALHALRAITDPRHT